MGIAYKMMRLKGDGKLYPLFVNANTAYPIGVWVDATEGERKSNGKVKSRIGDLHFRPGFHLSDKVPYEKHIGIKDSDGKIIAIHPDMVWCEVEYSDVINYQAEADKNGTNKQGKLIKSRADLDYIPVNGYYRYKTNPNMYGEWIIAGSMKIIKVLTDKEVEEKCEEFGLIPLPRFVKDK